MLLIETNKLVRFNIARYGNTIANVDIFIDICEWNRYSRIEKSISQTIMQVNEEMSLCSIYEVHLEYFYV